MPVNRRSFLKAAGILAVNNAVPVLGQGAGPGVVVNDIHSQLNPTRVREIAPIASSSDLRRAIKQAAQAGRAVSIAGGRHAMGAQQFAADSVLLDMTRFNRVRSFDRVKGVVEVDAGIMWPALVDYLLKEQAGAAAPVGHRAKADRRRSPDDWRGPVGQRAWPRVEDEAVCRRRRVVRSR